LGYERDSNSVFSLITQDNGYTPPKLTPIYHEYWSYDLGNPLHDWKTIRDKVYYREFRNGIVAANPTDKPHKIRFRKRSKYWTINKEPIDHSIVIKNHKGLILFNRED